MGKPLHFEGSCVLSRLRSQVKCRTVLHIKILHLVYSYSIEKKERVKNYLYTKYLGVMLALDGQAHPFEFD